MNCERRRNIVVVNQNGERDPQWKCAHAQACTYGKAVTEVECGTCVLRTPHLYQLNTCPQQKPAHPTYKQPIYGPDGELIYEPINGPEPSVPDGFEWTEPWIYKSKWQPCPYRQYLNRLADTGELILDTRCVVLNKKVCFEDCDKCLIDIHNLGEVPESVVPEIPGIGQQLATYWKALKKWIAAGRPERSDAEVEQIHAQHCSKCDWYDAESKRCKGCGCKVKAAGAAMMNKIKMATEHCPRNFW